MFEVLGTRLSRYYFEVLTRKGTSDREVAS